MESPCELHPTARNGAIILLNCPWEERVKEKKMSNMVVGVFLCK